MSLKRIGLLTIPTLAAALNAATVAHVDPNIKEFATEQEMLACMGAFYDWDSRKETYPHRPPELDVWKYIERQLG